MIQKLHSSFCASTGVTLRLGIGEYNRERAWHVYVQSGFTEHDLLLVINHLKREIREKRRFPGALRFSNLIERPELFEEELGLARALARRPKETALDRVKALRERPVERPVTHTAQPISHYIEQLRQAAQ